MFEETYGAGVAIEHQVFADEAAGVGEAVRELPVGGEQEQARGFRAVGTNDDNFSFLQMSVALFIEINGAGDAAQLIRFNSMNIGIRPNLTTSTALRQGDDTGKRAGFR